MLKNLKSIRRETNLSQKQVAEKLNISQQTYSDYENCKTEPSSDTLTEIAKLFDVSVDELLGREDFTPEERAAGAMATRKVIKIKNNWKIFPAPKKETISSFR